MQCASQLLAARASVASDQEALYLLNAVRGSCSLMLSTINNVLDLRVLEQPGPAGRVVAVGRMQARQRLNPRAIFADVLDVCRVACCKDIAWVNEGDAVNEELEARAAAARICQPSNALTCDLLFLFPVFPACRAMQGNPERLRQVLQNLAVVCVRYAGELPVQALLRCCTPEGGGAPDGFLLLAASFTAVGLTMTADEAGSAFQLESCAGLALLVARSVARGLDGDVALDGHSDGSGGGVSFALRVRLFRPGAPPLPAQRGPAASPRQPAAAAAAAASAQQQAAAAPSAPAAAPSAAGPAPPPIDLTTKLFEYLVKHSDEVFHAGQCTPQGLNYVRGASALLFRLSFTLLYVSLRTDACAARCPRARGRRTFPPRWSRSSDGSPTISLGAPLLRTGENDVAMTHT
jgi:hypothetical protein